MARVTRAVSHLSAEEIKQRLKHDSRPWCRERWLIIYNALVEPRKAEEIAKHGGVSKGIVHQVISCIGYLAHPFKEKPFGLSLLAYLSPVAYEQQPAHV